MLGPDPDSPWSSWRDGLCEKTGISLYGGSGRIEQDDSPKNKKTLGGTLGNNKDSDLENLQDIIYLYYYFFHYT